MKYVTASLILLPLLSWNWSCVLAAPPNSAPGIVTVTGPHFPGATATTSTQFLTPIVTFTEVSSSITTSAIFTSTANEVQTLSGPAITLTIPIPPIVTLTLILPLPGPTTTTFIEGPGATTTISPEIPGTTTATGSLPIITTTTVRTVAP
ncbi:hypothetical protein EST38_g5657 [Candolleomyces aberdarensis]|uniref:Uncharacterized protein n=1 Tax=Candolleomyces aberdarensis TaxID=2316362 RepID=A0A4Q2DJX6_9AGAR|nr:hypothetical protein EST38_g5657 [Candolleomyces aberdarensis]